MAKCADCVHVDVCEDITRHKLSPERAKELLPILRNSGKICDHFQDRSRLVELPQSVHLCDAVHFVLKGLDEIDLQEYTFTVGKNAVSDTVQFITEIGTYGFWVGESPREFAPDYDDFYYWYELGETVFLSREEAEQFLKEREENG